MKKTYVPVPGRDMSRGIPALAGGKVAYSDAVRIDLADHTLLFVSGKLGTGPDLALADRNMREQTRQALANIKAAVEGQGGQMSDVVRFRIFVTAMDQASIRDVHAARMEFFSDGEYPASTLVRVDQFVRDGALIEIEADVVMPRNP